MFRPTILLALAVTAFLVPRPARAQGVLQIFPDPGYASCSIVDVADETYTFYVVHVPESGAIGVDNFHIYESADVTYIGEEVPWLFYIGDSQGGMAVAYEACLTGEILVCTVTYTGTGNSAPCSSVEVRAAFTSNEEVREITCDPRAIAIPRTSLGRVTMNPDETCPCGVPVPVEETSWGRVQALYD